MKTFSGPHNPPYGLETIIFYVGPLDAVRLVNFEHQMDEIVARIGPTADIVEQIHPVYNFKAAD